jgi:hypothetical protein
MQGALKKIEGSLSTARLSRSPSQGFCPIPVIVNLLFHMRKKLRIGLLAHGAHMRLMKIASGSFQTYLNFLVTVLIAL